MEFAEVYMLLLRKTTLAPVIGEAMGEGFWGQCDLDGWTWNIANEDRVAKLKENDRKRDETLDPERRKREKERLFGRLVAYRDAGDKKKLLYDVTRRKLRDIEDEEIEELKKGKKDKSKDKDDPDDASGNPLKFTFNKRVDTASTQMLNMMKGGIPFERAVVTVVHRAGIMSKIPGFLSLQFKDLLLTDYDLSVTQDETGTELNETWEAEFTHVMFEYSRRMDPLSASNALATAMGKTMFVMKPRLA